jgi:hypothetical protein
MPNGRPAPDVLAIMRTAIRLLDLRLAVLGLALLAAACDVRVDEKGVSLDIVEGKATDEWSRTYTLQKNGQLEIVNASGTIEAFPATGSQVEVRIQREAKSKSDDAAQAILKGLRVVEEVAPDRVKVDARQEGQQRGFLERVRMNFRVNVPPGLRVSFRTENGNVVLENVQGDISASATNGNVNGRGLEGPLQVSSVNGTIQMELSSVAGDVHLSTVNGRIRLTIPVGANATLEASAVNGGVAIDDALGLKESDRDMRHVSGQFNAGGPRLELQTTNGPIRVSAPGEAERPDRVGGMRGR